LKKFFMLAGVDPFLMLLRNQLCNDNKMGRHFLAASKAA
jgi:hypothetical protein